MKYYVIKSGTKYKTRYYFIVNKPQTASGNDSNDLFRLNPIYVGVNLITSLQRDLSLFLIQVDGTFMFRQKIF